jgi:hypothetical protein
LQSSNPNYTLHRAREDEAYTRYGRTGGGDDWLVVTVRELGVFEESKA